MDLWNVGILPQVYTASRPRRPRLETLNLCYFLSMRAQVSRPYKIAGRIIVFLCFNFKSLDRRQHK